MFCIQEIEELEELSSHNLNVPMLFVNMARRESVEDAGDGKTKLTRLGLYEQLGKQSTTITVSYCNEFHYIGDLCYLSCHLL